MKLFISFHSGFSVILKKPKAKSTRILVLHCYDFKRQKKKNIEFANIVDPDKAAHNEPSHLDLHCLPSSHDLA